MVISLICSILHWSQRGPYIRYLLYFYCIEFQLCGSEKREIVRPHPASGYQTSLNLALLKKTISSLIPVTFLENMAKNNFNFCHLQAGNLIRISTESASAGGHIRICPSTVLQNQACMWLRELLFFSCLIIISFLIYPIHYKTQYIQSKLQLIRWRWTPSA